MKSFWQLDARTELLQRLEQLTPESRAQWGRMNGPQVLAHVADSLRMTLGELPVKPRESLLRPWPFKQLIIYFLRFPKGAPTAPELIQRPPRDWSSERPALCQLLNQLATLQRRPFPPEHPAFGKMTEQGWGVLVYRHVDHHLRQFGV
jgi:hypothetical protein